MTAEIVDFPAPAPDAAFFERLEIPPGVAAWLASWGAGYSFAVYPDPATGRLAGIVRSDLLPPSK